MKKLFILLTILVIGLLAVARSRTEYVPSIEPETEVLDVDYYEYDNDYYLENIDSMTADDTVLYEWIDDTIEFIVNIEIASMAQFWATIFEHTSTERSYLETSDMSENLTEQFGYILSNLEGILENNDGLTIDEIRNSMIEMLTDTQARFATE